MSSLFTTRRLLWVVSFATVLVCCLVFARFASFSRGIPDDYKIEKKIRILTYGSFVDKNSAGSYLLEYFKRECFCKVEVVSVVDSGLLLERLRMSTGENAVDLVIGLDQILLEKAKDLQWRQLNSDMAVVDDELKPFLTNNWIPFDWSPLTFVYRKGEGTPVNNLLELLTAENGQKISLPDPRTSALGQQFLLWLLTTAGDLQNFERIVKQLNKQKFEITPSWTVSYNAFRQNQSQFALTYLTSLIFHWEAEKEKNYEASVFAKGHPVQVEYVGIPENAQHIELAEKFIRLMLSDDGQKVIMLKNYMMPVRKSIRAGSAYEQLPDVNTLDVDTMKRNISILKEAQDIWSKVF